MKKKVVLIVTILLLVLIATLTGSVAFFSRVLNIDNEATIALGDIRFKYTEVTGIGNGINLDDPDPVDDATGKASINTFNFKVDGKLSRSDLVYYVSVRPTAETTMPLDGIKVYITEVVDGEEVDIASNYDNSGKVKTLTDYDNLVIYTEKIERNDTAYEKNFKVRIWIDEECDFGEYVGKTGGFYIDVKAESDVSDVAGDSTTDTDTRLARVEANNTYTFIESEEENVDYEVNVPGALDEIEIEVIPENTDATVTIVETGMTKLSNKEKFSLNVGDNYFKVTITSTNSVNSKSYYLKVNRDELPVDTVELTPKTAEYTGSPIEANQAESLSKGAITYKYYASSDCSGEEIAIPTEVGNYSVKAISESKKDMVSGNICVTHTITANTDNYLKDLTIPGYQLNETFEKEKADYTVTVDTTDIEVVANAEGAGATVSGTGQVAIKDGDVLTVTVSSQSGATKEYKITVTYLEPTAPVINGGSNTWTYNPVTISVSTPGTAASGIKEYEYFKTTSTILPTADTIATGKTANTVTVSDDAITYIYYRTISNSGSKSAWSDSQIVKKDDKMPTNLTVTASDNIASGSWHTKAFTLNFSATKNGPSNLIYRYGIVQPDTIASSITVDTNTEETTYRVMVCNEAGTCNTSLASYKAKLDMDTPLAPGVTGGSTEWANSRTFILSNPESTSGISTYEYYVSDSNTVPATTVTPTASILNPSFTVTAEGEFIFFRVINNANTKGAWSNAYNLYVGDGSLKISDISANSIVKISNKTYIRGTEDKLLDTTLVHSECQAGSTEEYIACFENICNDDANYVKSANCSANVGNFMFFSNLENYISKYNVPSQNATITTVQKPSYTCRCLLSTQTETIVGTSQTSFLGAYTACNNYCKSKGITKAKDYSNAGDVDVTTATFPVAVPTSLTETESVTTNFSNKATININALREIMVVDSLRFQECSDKTVCDYEAILD